MQVSQNARDNRRRRMTRAGISLKETQQGTHVIMRHGNGAKSVTVASNTDVTAERICELLTEWKCKRLPRNSREARAEWIADQLKAT